MLSFVKSDTNIKRPSNHSITIFEHLISTVSEAYVGILDVPPIEKEWELLAR